MTTKGILILAFAFTFTSNTAFAAEVFESLQIDNKKCNLVLSGIGNKEIVYSGKSEFGHCFVTIPTTDFHKKYSLCALSGVIASKGKVLCEFGYYDKNHTQISFTSGPDQLCEFVCINR